MRSRQLQEQFDRKTEDHAASETEEHRETASDRWFPECHLPPPSESRGHATSSVTASERAYCADPGPPAGMERVEGSLWARDTHGNSLPPSLDDIAQGNVGDCYFMSALGALAATHPEKIVGMIQDHGAGVYTVHFRNAGWSFISPTVTTDFDKQKHAYLSPRKALWPLVVERAFAQTKGSIDKLGEGGSPAGVLRDMVDMQTASFFLAQRDPDAILASLQKAKLENKAMTAMSPNKLEASSEVRTMQETTQGLFYRHAYVITEVDTNNRRLKLHNPWGRAHPNDTGWMPVDDFKRYFVSVNISG